MVQTRRVGAWFTLTLLVGLALAAPAGAAIIGLSPSRLTIPAGESASATVRIQSQAESCLSATTDAPGLSFSLVGDECGGDREVTLVVHTGTSTPPGTYAVEVRDRNSARTLTVTVDPPPPTSVTTTTTTTTTTPPPSTTSTTTTTTTTPSSSTSTPSPSTTAPRTTPTLVDGPLLTAPPLPTTTTVRRTSAERTTTTVTVPPRSRSRSRSRATSVEAGAATRSTVDAAPSLSAAGVERITPQPQLRSRSVADMIDRGPPTRGLFLPFALQAFAACVPTAGACVDDRWDLVLVSASAADLVWRPADDRAPTDDAILDRTSLAVVGATPALSPSTTFQLTLLDLRGPVTRLRSVERSLGADGRLTEPGDGPGVVAAALVGDDTRWPVHPAGSSALLREPHDVAAEDLLAVWPVFVVAPAATDHHVVYGIVPDPTWRTDGVVPLLGTEHLSYLALDRSGSRGLFVPSPDPLEEGASPGRPEGVDGSDAPLVAVALAFAALLVWVGPLARGRRRTDEQASLG